MTTIALFGAGGHMGTRIVNQLKDDPAYRMLYVEVSEAKRTQLQQRGLAVTAQTDAVATADVVILAVPDNRIGQVAAAIVPDLQSGALVICLDPAAPYAGLLPERDDVAYFVTHPAHPPLFNDEVDMEARRDYFGSGKAKQALVSALVQGSDEDYALGEAISSKVFGPILRSHRVSVKQLAMLEPVLSETVAATCLRVVREALDEAVRRGVPEEAARDFLMGHLNIAAAILFDEIEWDFSAGAKKAMDEAMSQLFRPDWRRVFDDDRMRESVGAITQPPSPGVA